MTNLSLNLDETAWQYAVDKANAAAKIAFDREEAEKHAKDANYAIQTFVPEIWQAYAQRIIFSMEASYAAQQKAEVTKAHLSVIAAQPTADIERMAKVAGLPPDSPERAQLAAAVDAIPSS